MKSSLPKQLSFRIVTIEILESSLNPPKEPLSGTNTFQFDISLEQRINISENMIIVVCSVSILNENKDQRLAFLKSSCIYSVDNLRDYSDEKSNKINLPNDFSISLNSIAISTTRGLIFSFLRGTFLHNAILPVVNPSSFEIKKPD